MLYLSACPTHLPACPTHLPACPAHLPACPTHLPACPTHLPACPTHLPACPTHLPACPTHLPACPSYNSVTYVGVVLSDVAIDVVSAGYECKHWREHKCLGSQVTEESACGSRSADPQGPPRVSLVPPAPLPWYQAHLRVPPPPWSHHGGADDESVEGSMGLAYPRECNSMCMGLHLCKCLRITQCQILLFVVAI